VKLAVALGSALVAAACCDSAAASETLAGPDRLQENSADRWAFRVMLDDREIGYHSFERQIDDDVEQISIEAEFIVKVLFVTAYRYEHDNRETWQAGCLQAIRSETDDNGTAWSITGEDTEGGFSLLRNESEATVERECVKTFAYWNPEILKADVLLNAQTGTLQPVTITHRGTSERQLQGVPVLSDEYVISTPDGDITVWYQQENRQWMGLETLAGGDRVLRYEPLEVPHPPATALNVAIQATMVR